ncbi:xylulokinase [Candidatus Woesebacteria bacterium]|nr:xylulokinase [Candidatus Woesebacteria bacterium]
MKTYLGLDLGTSVLKATVIDEKGSVLAHLAREITISQPKQNYAEESPQVWWETFKLLFTELNKTVPLCSIQGVGISGQMHGLVTLDKNKKPLRPAIIWADRRSEQEVQTILKKIPQNKMYSITGNPLFTGFMLPSLLWIQNHEKKLFRTIMHVCSPKDYIAFLLTGVLNSEPTDALATGVFDYKNNVWSQHILDHLEMPIDIFPHIIASANPYGIISSDASKETGLPENIPVFGASDQSMAALGAGLIRHGDALLAISTGGQFLVVSDDRVVDPKHRLHTLNHALTGKTIYMAATLSAGLSLKWFKTKVMNQIDSSYDHFIKEINDIPIGSDGLFFFPFLNGERTPYFNPNLRSAFIGQTLNHNNKHFIRAIMEGVAFSFREGLESFQELGIPIKNIILSGGGSKNPTWRSIVTNVLGLPTNMINIDDHSPYGAALFALQNTTKCRLEDIYKNVIQATNKLSPNKELHAEYNKIYYQYKKIAAYLNTFYS